MAGAVHPRPTHVAVHCTNPRSEPFRRSFHRSTEAITTFRCGSVDDETKPELLLGGAPSSLSIDLRASPTDHWSFSAPYSHTQLRYLPSPPTSLIINCVSERLNCTGTFQCRSMNEHATPRSLSSEESGRGSRSSGCLIVVVVSLFALLGRCVRASLKHLVVATSIANHKSTKSRFFVIVEKHDKKWTVQTS